MQGANNLNSQQNGQVQFAHFKIPVVIIRFGPGVNQFRPQVDPVAEFPEDAKVVPDIPARILGCGFCGFKIVSVRVVIESGLDPESGAGLCIEAGTKQGNGQGKQCSFHDVFFYGA